MTAPQTASAVTVPAANAHTDCVPQPATVEAPTQGPTRSRVEAEARFHRKRTSSCRQCGGNPHAVTNAFKAGVQAAVFDTYADNIAWTRRRTELEAERQNHARWSE